MFDEASEKWLVVVVERSPYSSVVEHPLSKRKVGSSILPGGKYHAFVSRADIQCYIRELSVLLSGRLGLFALMSTHLRPLSFRPTSTSLTF